MNTDKYIILVHPVTGKRRKVKKGFSKTVFFFGFFALLVRRQFIGAGIILGILFAIYTIEVYILEYIFGTYVRNITGFVYFGVWSAYSFVANKHLLKQLLKNGFQTQDNGGMCS